MTAARARRIASTGLPMPGRTPYIQAMRGLAIAAVVLIHCLPESSISVVLRPFLNWAVALFLFLSGLLTSEEKVARGGVIKRRLIKVALPYLLWSMFYVVVSRPGNAVEAAIPILTGGASAQMYYLLVYAQLVVLTPVLFRLLRSHRMLLYLVSPVSIVLWELAAYIGIDLPNLGRLFPMWLIFYLVGLEWDRWSTALRKRASVVVAFAAIALTAQVVEGFLWETYGDYGMATTQLRLTNTVSSLSVIALFMLAPNAVRQRLSSCSGLVHLGDFSFGIYLCHIAPILVWGKFVPWDGMLPALAEWIFVITVSVLVILAVRRVLPQKVVRALGFE